MAEYARLLSFFIEPVFKFCLFLYYSKYIN